MMIQVCWMHASIIQGFVKDASWYFYGDLADSRVHNATIPFTWVPLEWSIRLWTWVARTLIGVSRLFYPCLIYSTFKL